MLAFFIFLSSCFYAATIICLMEISYQKKKIEILKDAIRVIFDRFDSIENKSKRDSIIIRENDVLLASRINEITRAINEMTEGNDEAMLELH